MLRPALARRFARLALGCVTREFPSNPAHVLESAKDLRRPRDLHPAFYGCYDWHSAVHGHWLLAWLLRRFPALPQAHAMRRVLAAHLSERNLRAEGRYLETHPGFERPYGWAWLLKLACELPEHGALRALAELVEQRYLHWLPRQAHAIRSGTHVNTAFALALALDYARRFGRTRFEKALVEKSLQYYAGDRACPAAWEPGGNDFLSPCLVEADLMRRAHPRFTRWFVAFLPRLPASLRAPVSSGDRSDGQLAHLDGLNLSRAWCLYALSRFSARRQPLRECADRHLRAGLASIESGHYAGEHWLASFAAYACEEAETR